MNREPPDVQAGFRKGRGTRDQIANMPTSIASLKSKRVPDKYDFCFIDYAKAFECVDHYKLWKILKEMRIPHHLTCLPRIRYAAQEATGRIGHRTGSNLEKEYIKVVYCHHAYLTYMPSTSCDMLGSMKHKLESRLLRKI